MSPVQARFHHYRKEKYPSRKSEWMLNNGIMNQNSSVLGWGGRENTFSTYTICNSVQACTNIYVQHFITQNHILYGAAMQQYGTPMNISTFKTLLNALAKPETHAKLW